MSGHHPKNKLLRALHEMQNTTCCLLTSQPFHTSQISVNQNKTAKLLNNDNNLTIIITFLNLIVKLDISFSSCSDEWGFDFYYNCMRFLFQHVVHIIRVKGQT